MIRGRIIMENDILRSFEDIREEILLYKKTSDESIFNNIIKNKHVKLLLCSMARKKINYSPTTLNDLDDLLSVSYIELWRSIKNYKFICPKCGIKTSDEDAYNRHVKQKHKQYMEPKPTIDKYILYNIGVYVQNCIRDEYNISRKSNHFMNQDNIFSPVEEAETKSSSDMKLQKMETKYFMSEDIQNEVVFKMVLDDIIKDEDEITKKIFSSYMKGHYKCDIAEDLYQTGIYRSRDSAAVMVSRKTREILNKFSKLYSMEK